MTSRLKHPVSQIISTHKGGTTRGIYSVCSSNEHVLRASFEQAGEDGSFLLVEATCNQVNQFGGYTGMVPGAFAEFMETMGQKAGFPREKLILGGDHLGPTVWKNEPADQAMDKARVLMKEYAEAGFTKIHLDASPSCAGDPVPLPDEIVAERSAELCAVAEQYRRPGIDPVYVVGTEVPVPGGVQDQEEGLHITEPAEAETTISNARRAFLNLHLEEAWERVVALVVQPGVEFGNDFIIDYDREKARDLSGMIEGYPGMTLEAHSTDYQKRENLRQMVEDNFSILKVGPWLTFALREAVQALSSIEMELISTDSSRNLSGIGEVLEQEMMADPGYWQKYYPGTPAEQLLQRRYSFSDRVRYYWQRPRVEGALEKLFSNLRETGIPLSLLSQYLPVQYDSVREGCLRLDPESLARDKIRDVLRIYSFACR
jgi:D-tagatose-1,6-bisphosphate aldolase subunit GatZ/KbaZ